MKKNTIILVAAAIFVIASAFAYYFVKHTNMYFVVTHTPKPLKPEISGWMAWWKEPQAYELLGRRAKNFRTISPYWYEVNESFTLEDVSETPNKAEVVKNLTAQGIEVLPLINTGLSLDELSPLFVGKHGDTVIDSIVKVITEIGAPGADIDIEEIAAGDRKAFTAFLKKLRVKFTEKGLKLAITVVSQTGNADADTPGTEGVDYTEVGMIADVVNIMVYDMHATGSFAGPITTIPWLQDVMRYALLKIPKEKIVIGLPMYGYNWQKGSIDPDPYSYDEFLENIDSDSTYKRSRDKESAQLRYVGVGEEAWLSDAQSVKEYIKAAQSFGLNRFKIWQIGGMDERIF